MYNLNANYANFVELIVLRWITRGSPEKQPELPDLGNVAAAFFKCMEELQTLTPEPSQWILDVKLSGDTLIDHQVLGGEVLEVYLRAACIPKIGDEWFDEVRGVFLDQLHLWLVEQFKFQPGTEVTEDNSGIESFKEVALQEVIRTRRKYLTLNLPESLSTRFALSTIHHLVKLPENRTKYRAIACHLGFMMADGPDSIIVVYLQEYPVLPELHEPGVYGDCDFEVLRAYSSNDVFIGDTPARVYPEHDQTLASPSSTKALMRWLGNY